MSSNQMLPASLERLDLSGSTLGCELGTVLSNCASLREIVLSETTISSLPVLPAPESVVALVVSWTNLQASSIQEIARMVNLRRLLVAGTGITVSDLRDVIDITRLDFLDIAEYDLFNRQQQGTLFLGSCAIDIG